MRVFSKVSTLILISAAFLSACTEKPKGQKGEGSKAMFQVASKADIKTSRASVDDQGLPNQVSYDITICLRDAAKNEEVVEHPFAIREAATGKTISGRKMTDQKGCLNWVQTIPFTFLSRVKFVEYPIIIESLGRLRGQVTHRLALNPWAVVLKDSKYPSYVDMDFGSVPDRALLVKASAGADAFKEQALGNDRAQLYFENVKVTISQSRPTEEGQEVNLYLSGQPFVLLVDAGGENVRHEIEQGNLILQPSLLYSTPVPSESDLIKNKAIALHDNLQPSNVKIEPMRGFVYKATFVVPQYDKMGEIWLALTASYLGINRVNAKSSRMKALMTDQYDALYFVGDSREFLKASTPLLIADTVQGMVNDRGSNLKPNLTILNGMDLFNYADFMVAAVPQATIRQKIAEDSLSNPHMPAFEGLAPTKIVVGYIDKVSALEIGKEPVAPNETVLERTMITQIRVCLLNSFTKAPIEHRDITVYSTRNELVDSSKTRTLYDGCLAWNEPIHYFKYDTQH